MRDGKLAGGPPMRPAYEDCGLAPKSPLTRELMSCTLEDELHGSADGGENDRDIMETEHPPINSLISAMIVKEESLSMVDTGLEDAAGSTHEYIDLEAISGEPQVTEVDPQPEPSDEDLKVKMDIDKPIS